MKRTTSLWLALVLFSSFALPAFAITLDEAKSQGLVGEMADGYLGVVKETPEAAKLVSDINNKRKEEYQAIAASNKLDLGTVEKLAGAKAIEKTGAGQFIKTSGAWQKK